MYLAKRKNGYYYVEYFDKSESRNRRISTKSKYKKEALRFLSDLTLRLNSIHQEKFISLEEFKKEYISFMARTYSKKYISTINLSYNQLIKSIGNVPLKRITTKLCQLFLSETFSRTKRGATLYHRTLKAGFIRAIEWGYLNENPFERVRLPKIEKAFPIFISENELQIILDNTEDLLLREIFFIAFYTGMRLGEIINLKWIGIDFPKKTIFVKNDITFSTKNKKERIIPISGKLFPVLRDKHLREIGYSKTDYVFTRVLGVRLNQEFISKQFKKIIRNIGMDERIKFHTLRHSFASNLVQKGASIYIVKELMGHSDVTTTQIYAHLNKENLEEVVNLLD